MFGFKRYNYDNFSKDLLMKDVLQDQFGGPEPGERAPNFKGRTLEGGEISLSQYRGDHNVVLTFGSATCPFTAASIGGISELYHEYSGDDVQFLFIYVREAHPGERLPAHNRIEDKQHAAELFRREEELEIPIVVDDLKGSIHRRYGKLPNPTYLIDKSGRVAFRCLWTRVDVVEDALEELLERQRERDAEHAIVRGGEDTSMPSLYGMLHSHRALERGGSRAIREFRREMGVPGRIAVTASRLFHPVAEQPGKIAASAAIAAGVVIGSILLGRYLRQQRLRARTPYDIESLGVPRRRSAGGSGDYEAVGI